MPQQYVPQTSYRPIFASAPTATYVRRPALVPYTTYLIGPRPVCSSCPSAAYAGCSTGACGGYAPSAAYVPAAPGGCSSCAVGSAPAAMTVAPTTVAPMPAPATSQPTPSPEVAPLEGPPQTFRTPEPARTESHKVPAESDGPALEPTPMAPEQAPVQGSSYRPGPQIAPFGTPPGFRLDDRTTFRPVTPTRFRTASLTQTVPATPAASSPAVIDNGGWRPATD